MCFHIYNNCPSLSSSIMAGSRGFDKENRKIINCQSNIVFEVLIVFGKFITAAKLSNLYGMQTLKININSYICGIWQLVSFRG